MDILLVMIIIAFCLFESLLGALYFSVCVLTVYTTSQKFWIGKIFYVFKISLFCSARLHLFD